MLYVNARQLSNIDTYLKSYIVNLSCEKMPNSLIGPQDEALALSRFNYLNVFFLLVCKIKNYFLI